MTDLLQREEALFFFITNMLITSGMTLLLTNISQERFAEIKRQVRGWKEWRALQIENVATTPRRR